MVLRIQIAREGIDLKCKMDLVGVWRGDGNKCGKGFVEIVGNEVIEEAVST